MFHPENYGYNIADGTDILSFDNGDFVVNIDYAEGV